MGSSWSRRAVAHPVATTAAAAAAVAAGQLWWLSRHRHLGMLHGDEAGYTSTAVHMARLARSGDWSGALEWVGGFSPVVPLLSMVALLIGPDSVNTPMVVPVLGAAVAAVAAAGITRRVAGDRPSLVAGCVALGMPGMLTAVRSYGFAFPATACLTVAVWALLASDRGERRTAMAACGVAIGAMVLTRTMTIAFLPALVAGVAIEVRRSRTALVNTALAFGIAVAIASVWWTTYWRDTLGYLTDAGYGERAAQLGDDSLPIRVLSHAAYLANGSTFLVPLLVAVVVLATAQARRAGRFAAGTPWTESRRRRVVLAVLAVWGFAATVSTQNGGWLNEAPFVYTTIALATSLGVLCRPRARRILGGLAVGGSMLVLLLAMTDDGTKPTPNSAVGVVRLAFYGGSHTRLTQLGNADERIRGPERERAAREWWTASVRATRLADEVAESPRRSVFGGSNALANPSTLQLAWELHGDLSTVTESGDGIAADRLARRLLAPGRQVVVFVLARSDQLGGSDDTRRAERRARRLGWVVRGRVPLPDGGVIEVMTHPGGSSPG